MRAPRWATILLGAAAIARAESSPGGPAPLALPAASLAAGRVVEQALPDAIRPGAGHEMELVLSLDDGATYPLRLTRSEDAAAAALRWRVPALPSARARLALRVGEEGREEEVRAVSAPFSITVADGTPPEELHSRLQVEGGRELATREAADPHALPAGHELAPAGDDINPLVESDALAEAPAPAPLPESAEEAPGRPFSHAAGSPVEGPRLANAPPSYPRRE